MKLCLLRIRANSTIPKKIPTTRPPTPATIGHMKSEPVDCSVLPGPVGGISRRKEAKDSNTMYLVNAKFSFSPVFIMCVH